MSSESNIKWGFFDSWEEFNGPYDSRAEAERVAKERIEPGDEFLIVQGVVVARMKMECTTTQEEEPLPEPETIERITVEEDAE